MRKFIPLLGLTLTLTSSLALADSFPDREPGLWEISITNGNSQAPQGMKECIDSATDAKMMQMGTDITKSMNGTCSQQDLKRTPSGFESNSECKMMGSTIKSKATFSGDFKRTYFGEIVSTFTPPLMGQSTSTTKITAKHTGSCGADMKPGEIIMANGIKMNMNEAVGNVKAAASQLKNSNLDSAMTVGEDANEAMAEAMKHMDPKSADALKQAMKQLDGME